MCKPEPLTVHCAACKRDLVVAELAEFPMVLETMVDRLYSATCPACGPISRLLLGRYQPPASSRPNPKPGRPTPGARYIRRRQSELA